MSDPPEVVKLGFVGDGYPCREGKAVPGTVFACPRNDPLQQHADAIAAKLGVASLADVSLFRNTVKLPDVEAGDAVDASDTPDALGFRAMGVLVVKAKPAPAAAAAPAASAAEQPAAAAAAAAVPEAPAAAAPAAAPTPSGEVLKVGFVGEGYPCREGKAIPATVATLPRDVPLAALAAELAAAIGAADLAGVALHANTAKLPEVEAGDVLDTAASFDALGFKKLAVVVVVKGAPPPPPAAPPQEISSPAPEPAGAPPVPQPAPPPAAAAGDPEPPAPAPEAAVAAAAPAAAPPKAVTIQAPTDSAPTPVTHPAPPPSASAAASSSSSSSSLLVPPSLQVITTPLPAGQAELSRLVELQRAELARLRQELLRQQGVAAAAAGGSAEASAGELQRARQMVARATGGRGGGLEQLLVRCDGFPELDGVYTLCGVSDDMPAWASSEGHRLQSAKGYWAVSDVPGHSVYGRLRSAARHGGRMPPDAAAAGGGWSVANRRRGAWEPSRGSDVRPIELGSGEAHEAFHMVQQRTAGLEKQLADALLKAAPARCLVTCPRYPQLEGLYDIDQDPAAKAGLRGVHPVRPLYRREGSGGDTVLYASRSGAWCITTAGTRGLQQGGALVKTTGPCEVPEAAPAWIGHDGLDGWDLLRMSVVPHNDLAPLTLQSMGVSGMLREAGEGVLRERYVKWLRYAGNARAQHRWAVRLSPHVRGATAGALLELSDTLMLRTYFRRLRRGREGGRELGQSAPEPPGGGAAAGGGGTGDVDDLPVDAGEPSVGRGSPMLGSPPVWPSPPHRLAQPPDARHPRGTPSPSPPPPPYYSSSPSSYGGSPSPPPYSSPAASAAAEAAAERVVARGVEEGVRRALTPAVAASPFHPSTSRAQQRLASVASVVSTRGRAALPKELDVVCPDAPDLSGVYTLSSGAVNRRACWRRDRCTLYSTNDAYNWMITDTPGTEAMNRGWVRSRGPHRDRPPHEVLEWERWGSEGWACSTAITVTPVLRRHFDEVNGDYLEYEARARASAVGMPRAHASAPLAPAFESSNFQAFCAACGQAEAACTCAPSPDAVVAPAALAGRGGAVQAFSPALAEAQRTHQDPPHRGYQASVPGTGGYGGPWLAQKY